MQIKWLEESGIALNAVSDAGTLLLNRVEGFKISTKDALRDLVTEYDYEVQAMLLDKLKVTPYPILSEELPRSEDAFITNKGSYWIIDPIDGTVNFAYSLHLYSVSVGLCLNNTLSVGAVSLPALKELYFTYGNHAAYMNGKRLNCDYDTDLKQTLISASFSSFDDPIIRNKQYALFGEINDNSRGCLRLGSAATSLCFVVAKRLNAAYGLKVKIWDIAGGMAIAKLAGYETWIHIHDDLITADFIVGTPNVVTSIANLMEQHALITKREFKK